MFSLKRSHYLVLMCLLAGCAIPPPRHGPAEHRPDEPNPPVGAAVFRVDAQQSEIRFLVYRAGALANLGHNHVIAFHPLRGWVVWAVPPARSALRLEFPVESALVDEPAMRREEGADFPGEIETDAKSSTLHNLLSEAMLDAAHYPLVVVGGSAVADGAGLAGDGPGQLFMPLRFTVAGHDSTVNVPVTVERSGARMTASGHFDVKQSELGLKPFSILLGALQVQDQMRVKFRIVANR